MDSRINFDQRFIDSDIHELSLMQKIFSYILILAALLTLLALMFDWGRGGNPAPDAPQNTALATSSDIVIFSPIKNQAVVSPIVIRGKAKGNWFFEASFPVRLVDENENVVGTGHAEADGDWMTSDFVNFTATIEYTRASTTDSGLLVFKNDNPSGDPARDKYFYMPVVLK
jgi:hypothetical protein